MILNITPYCISIYTRYSWLTTIILFSDYFLFHSIFQTITNFFNFCLCELSSFRTKTIFKSMSYIFRPRNIFQIVNFIIGFYPVSMVYVKCFWSRPKKMFYNKVRYSKAFLKTIFAQNNKIISCFQSRFEYSVFFAKTSSINVSSNISHIGNRIKIFITFYWLPIFHNWNYSNIMYKKQCFYY